MPSTRTRRDSVTMTLKDGTRVLFRPITIADRDRLQEGFALLSEEARYLRFFSHTNSLTDEQLKYFTDIDQINHVAWGALDPEALDFPGFGVGRFVRLEDPSVAEAAVTVLDDYQGKGLGTLFVALLYLLAEELGVRTLRGTILPENRFFIDWLHHLGATTEFVEGAIRVEISVGSDRSRLPQSATTSRFFKTLEKVRQELYE